MKISTNVYYNPSGWFFFNPVKITTGRGCRQALSEQLEGQTLLIVTTKRGRCQICEDVLLGPLVTQNTVIWVDSVQENPGLKDLQATIEALQKRSWNYWKHRLMMNC